jgi:hypothetical protein
VNDVDGVVRTEALRKHIVDACALKHCTHWAAGDNTGTRRGWSQKDNACCCFTLHWVRDGCLNPRNLEEVLLSLFNALGDRGWNFFSLAVTNAYGAFAIANHNKCGEAEATAALDDLGNAVDGDNTLYEWGLFNWRLAVFATATTLAAGTFSAATLLPCCCSSHCGLPFRRSD